MIGKITIEGFKSIYERLTLELGSINVFVGPNGSGKSALLEAVGVLGSAAEGRVDDAALMRRGVRPGVPALYKSSFANHRYRRFITLRADWSGDESPASYEVGLDNPIETPEPAWKYRTESVTHRGRKLPGFTRSPRSKDLPVDDYAGLAAHGFGSKALPGPARSILAWLRDFAIFAPTTAALRGTEPDLQQRSPLGLSGGRLAEAVSDLLRLYWQDPVVHPLDRFVSLLGWVSGMGVQAAPPSRETLSPSVPTTSLTVAFEDRFMRDGRNQLMAYDASEGALYVLFLAVLALHTSAPSLFAIDNFDHAMNPRMARSATRLLCDCLLNSPRPRQALLTTHNPLVLDGLDIRDERIRLFTVDRKTDGVTFLRRVTLSPSVVEAAKDGLSLSRLWLSGRLGGMPNV